MFQQVNIRFTSFHLESCSGCSCDYLRLYDGGDETAPLLGNFCGSIIPPQQTTTADQAFLHFHSDVSQPFPGFQLGFERLETGKLHNKLQDI